MNSISDQFVPRTEEEFLLLPNDKVDQALIDGGLDPVEVRQKAKAFSESLKEEYSQDNKLSINTLMREYTLSTVAITNAKQLMANMIEVIKSSMEYKQFQQFVELEQPKVDEMKKQIEKNAIDIFKETQSKKPIEGIGIRETPTVTYDEPKAIEWCKVRMPELLNTSVDKGGFEKIMKAFDKDKLPEFVTIKDVTSVTFAKDLSMWLPKMDGE